MTKTTIVEEAPVPTADWEAYVERHPDATPFHGARWLRAVSATFGYRSHSCLGRREGKVCGVLPLFAVPTLPTGVALVSTPQAVYGGVCADDIEVASTLLEHARNLGARTGARYVELRHRTPHPDLPTKDLYVTFRREIDRDPDVNMARIPRNQRRSIRVGQKHGLRAEVGGENLLRGFYRVYAASVRNLGSPVFPISLFRRLLQEYGDDARILAVFHGDRMVSGVLTLFYRDQVLPYYGGAIREAFPLSASDFMYWSLLCHAAERGCRIFDFGRSKLESGSYRFKRHWGFEPTPLAYQYQLLRESSMPDLSPRNPRFSLAIRAWRHLPLWVTMRLGPRLVRYFP